MTTYKIKSIKHDTVQTNVPEEDAARFLRISVPKLLEKAQYREPVRGAWTVEMEIPPEPPAPPKERTIKTGFSETEWEQFKVEWRTACHRIAEAARMRVPWLEGVA